MRTLNVQLQPDIAPALDEARLRDSLCSVADWTALVASFETREGDDSGRYVNFNYESRNHTVLWRHLSKLWPGESELARQLGASTIVACEGSEGWDNYLLLHHSIPKSRWTDWLISDEREWLQPAYHRIRAMLRALLQSESI